MKKLFGLIFASAIFFLTAHSAFAGGSSCQPMYSGGQTCPSNVTFTINKLVQNPTKGGNFVENLTLQDPLFSQNQDVMFQIKIKNTSDTKIDSIDVVDTLPTELTFSAGSGNFNSADNTVRFTVNNLDAGKEAVYFINAKLVNMTSTKCPVNFVRATANSGATATDQSSFCVTTTGTQIMTKPMIKSQPATGPETDLLVGLVSTGALGMFLRKKIK